MLQLKGSALILCDLEKEQMGEREGSGEIKQKHKSQGNLKEKMNRMSLWSKNKSSQEHSLNMAEMYLLKSEVGKTREERTKKSLSAQWWACLRVLDQDHNGGEVVAKSNPGFSCDAHSHVTI